MVAKFTDIGAVLVSTQGIKPADTVPATITGAAIDRQGHLSGVLAVTVGDATGSPTGQTVDAKIQEGDTSGGSFTDVTGAAITQITTDDVLGSVDLQLKPVKRFIKVVVTVTLTAGSSPTIPVGAVVTLGPKDVIG